MNKVNNTFTTVALNEAEQRASFIFNSLNIAMLQNQLASVAEEKLNLPFTPNDTLTYAQQEAYLKGQMDLLRYLIQSHEESSQHQSTRKE